jgi:chromosome segregation ATPase
LEDNKKKKKPFYLNWKLWVTVSISLILTTVGLVLAFGPVAIIAPIGVIAAIVSATAGPVIEAWEKVDDKLKEVRKKAEHAEEKAVIEGARNTAIERKADRAASTAEVLAVKVNDNAERADLLEQRSEALSDMAYKLTENLQKAVDKSEAKIANLEAKHEKVVEQNQEQQHQMDLLTRQNQGQQEEINRLKEIHQREITGLKEEIRLMGVEKSSDKEKIVRLESQVEQLQNRVKELEDRENKLNDENLRLKEELRSVGRRSTDQLTGLSPDAEDKLNHLEKERQEAKGEI